MSSEQVSVLFVCLGNICRSTMAEAIFTSMAKSPPYKGLVGKIDSCGTGAYHAGDDPDSRTMSTLEEHGITGYTHGARRIRQSDFDDFDYILAMDNSNLSDLRRYGKQDGKARVMLFGEYSGTGRKEPIQDPYYGGRDGFETAYEQCTRFADNFLKHVFPDAK